jgi:hypothetical protein
MPTKNGHAIVSKLEDSRKCGRLSITSEIIASSLTEGRTASPFVKD